MSRELENLVRFYRRTNQLDKAEKLQHTLDTIAKAFKK